MRRGIGLRGYAQQEPLNEFRREAYRLYEELRGLIRHGVASSIFRVTVQTRRRPTGARRGTGAQARRAGGPRRARTVATASAWRHCRSPRPAGAAAAAARPAGLGDRPRARPAPATAKNVRESSATAP